MDVEIMKFDHGNPVSRERVKHLLMGEVFAMLVLADDRAGDYESLARMLAGDFCKKGFLLGCRQIVQTFDGGDDAISFIRSVQKIQIFKGCIRQPFCNRPTDGNAARVLVYKTEHGTPSSKYLPREFFESAEYQRIADLARTLAGLIGEGAYVTRGEERHEIGSFKEAMKWLFDQARKGQTIQRYKGLGEMNPEQLWETTLDPNTRVMLQVRLDDAVQTDQIFTILMGDQVEPRRQFIEDNALNVKNLDI